MAIPSQYLTSTRNLKGILDAIGGAQAPKKFTFSFLERLGFKSSSDRLIIGVLKALGFLTPAAEPTNRYFRFLDGSQSKTVLGEALQDAYSDLFQVNKKAYELSRADLKNKLRTITQGQLSDAVLDKVAMTFKAFAALADFSAVSTERTAPERREGMEEEQEVVTPSLARSESTPVRLGGLVYNIQLILPEARDQAVYDALFKSLKEHLLR